MSSGEPWDYPAPVGLYDPAQEKDACGVGFIVSIDGIRTNKVRNYIKGENMRPKNCSCKELTSDQQ